MPKQLKVSLDGFDEYEEKHAVNTPRSLEACLREGVDPSELLYKPRESFTEMPQDVAELEYKFLEKRRMETLALVRSTRIKVIAEMESSHRRSSSAGMSQSGLYLTDLERAKEKHIKFINQLMEQETVATDKLQQVLREKEQRDEIEARRREEQIKYERKKAEEKRKSELEAVLREKQMEKAAKEAAFEKFRKVLETMREEEMKNKEKQRRAEQERQEHDTQRRFRLQKIEASLQQQFAEKERLLQEKRISEANRQQRLRQQRRMMKKHIESRSRANSQKRESVMENLKAKMEEKRKLYFELKEEKDRKTQRFLDEQRKSMENLRYVSSERNIRILKTRQASERIIEETKRELLRREQECDQKVREQRAKLEAEMTRRRNLDRVKELIKELNMQRYKRKEDYKAMNAKRRLEEQEQRVTAFTRTKSDMIGERIRLSTENDIQRYYMKEALFKMAVSKRWNFDLLKDLTAGKKVHSRRVSAGVSSSSVPLT